MGKLEKVIVENGITYVLGDDDIYYSDLQLPEGTNYNIGKFGHMRCEYLKEFKHGYYMELLLDGRLNEYLHEIDEACYEMRDRLVEKMKEKQGVTEQLKAENQMMWVGNRKDILQQWKKTKRGKRFHSNTNPGCMQKRSQKRIPTGYAGLR